MRPGNEGTRNQRKSHVTPINMDNGGSTPCLDPPDVPQGDLLRGRRRGVRGRLPGSQVGPGESGYLLLDGGGGRLGQLFPRRCPSTCPDSPMTPLEYPGRTRRSIFGSLTPGEKGRGGVEYNCYYPKHQAVGKLNITKSEKGKYGFKINFTIRRQTILSFLQNLKKSDKIKDLWITGVCHVLFVVLTPVSLFGRWTG